MRASNTRRGSFGRLFVVIGLYAGLSLANTPIQSSVSCATTLLQPPECQIRTVDTELEHPGATFQSTAVDNPEQTTTRWEIKQSPGKGLGMFATTLIKAGTRITAEEPLFAIDPPEFVPGKGYDIALMMSDVDMAVAALSPARQAEFHSCHEHRLPHESPTELHRNIYIFRSNAYTMDDGSIAIFPKVAKINHSCRPNAANVWSEASRRRIIWAARDIEPGEEITVTYIPLLKRRDERQKRLAQYGFRCDCEACRDHEHTDPSRVQMERLLTELQDRLARKTSVFVNKKLQPKAVALAEKLEEEHMMDYLGSAYHLAAEVSFRLDDITSAEKWARKALQLHENGDERSAAAGEARDYLAKIMA